MPPRPRLLLMAAGLPLLLLSGCKIQTGSYQIDSSKYVSVLWEKKYFWSKNRERWVTVARMPECQRKHRIEDDGESISEIRLRKIDDMNFIVVAGKTRYLARLEVCSLQPIAPDVPAESDLTGRFMDSDQERVPFVPATTKKTSGK